ncbi:MAG: hypothetical protein QM703_29265 [Gemmatales bacterium]
MSDTSLTLVHDAVDVLCREMAGQWQNGSCPPAEVFLQRLGENPTSEDAVRVIYEEICIRQDRGEQVNLKELESRFPQWSQELAVLLDCHRLMRSHPVAPQFPSVGETLGDFRLVSELGRGASVWSISPGSKRSRIARSFSSSRRGRLVSIFRWLGCNIPTSSHCMRSMSSLPAI